LEIDSQVLDDLLLTHIFVESLWSKASI